MSKSVKEMYPESYRTFKEAMDCAFLRGVCMGFAIASMTVFLLISWGVL